MIRRLWMPAVCLGFLHLVVVAPFVQDYTAQPASRYALTAAIVERGTIRVDDYDAVVGIDRVERDGHLYSDKAPAQPMLAVPFFALAKAVGAEPADRLRSEGNLGVWWLTLWFSAVPAAVLVTLLALTLRERPGALVAAAGIGFATLVLPFASELYAHVFVSLVGFVAWLLLRDGDAGWRALAAGGLVGLAVATEYPMAVLGVVLAGLLLARRSWGALGRFVAAGLPFAAFLAVYQWAAFGSLAETSYASKGETGPDVSFGFRPSHFVDMLFGTRGLAIFTPIVVVGIGGLIMMWVRRPSSREVATVSLVVVGAFLVLQASWGNPWGGEMPGPRYVIPALPFVAAGITEVWTWSRRVVVATAGIGAAAMAFPLVTMHLVEDGGSTVGRHLAHLEERGVSPTVFTLALGRWGWLVHGAAVIAAFVLFVGAVRRSPARPAHETASPAVV